mmetsp:Transcript_13470/g.40004  ORF Transcript_13470/g.40004 Transcript_13470/m.40004 type:complete len:272 (+) Transcript_13470:544-1359(+)
MEGRQIEVHVRIPHVVLQPHRDQRHHAREQQRRLRPGVGRLGILHLLGERPVGLRLERLPAEEPELHQLQGRQARLLEVGRDVLEQIAKDGHAGVLRDQPEVLQDHEVHPRRQRVQVVGHVGKPWRLRAHVSQQWPVFVELVRVPIQAKPKVDAAALLPVALSLQRIFADLPLQASPDLRGDDPRVRGEVRLAPRQPLADGRRVPEGLAQYLLVLEARVQVAGDESQCRLPVLGQADEQVPEFLRVDQRLRLVGPLAFCQSLGQLMRDHSV